MQLNNLFLLALAALTSAQNSTLTLTQVLSSQNATLSTLNSLLAGQPALVKALSSANNFTLVAPSNNAFSKFLATPANKAAAMDPATLTAVLQYHVLNGVFPASAFNTTQQFISTMLVGSTSNSTRILKNDTTPLAAVTGGQVVGAMVSGSKVMIMSGLKAMSTVETADLTFDGGVIHIIDTVLTVPPPPSTAALQSNLTSLASGLTSTKLLAAVDSLKDVTIFAPSNAAFEAVSVQTSSLTTQQLSGILEYHVINGTVAYSSLLTTGATTKSFKTLEGGEVNIRVENNKVFVNSAQVTLTDVIVSNGVVHVLDNVINPANSTAVPDPNAASQAIAFPGVSSTNGTRANSNSTTSSSSSSSSSAISPTPSKAGAIKAVETSKFGAASVVALLAMIVAVGL